MSTQLTREMSHRVTQQIAERPPRLTQNVIYCHPLEYPFFNALWGSRPIWDTRKFDLIIRWLFECRRKHHMGNKTGDPRWTMQALIQQYTQRIEALRK